MSRRRFGIVRIQDVKLDVGSRRGLRNGDSGIGQGLATHGAGRRKPRRRILAHVRTRNSSRSCVLPTKAHAAGAPARVLHVCLSSRVGSFSVG